MTTLKQQDDALIYVPAPEVSREFRREFNRLVPLCANGKDRMLRFSWGNDRTEYVAGTTIRRYADTDNYPAKYVGRCRWILEGWQPPTIYDESEWITCGSLLGEFPRSGVWDFIAYHVDSEDEYLALDESALKLVRSWVHWQSEGKKRSIEHLMEQKALRRQLADERKKEAAAAVSQKFGEDVLKEFDKAKHTPDAYSYAKDVKTLNAFETTPSGLLIPRN